MATETRAKTAARTGKWCTSGRAAKAPRSGDAKDPAAAAANDTGRAERSLWKGAISFGLVQIPVSIATAERPNELAFHQLDRHDHTPIGYERVNKRTGKKVAWDDIVKGYEVSKGSFVEVTDLDFKNANVEASRRRRSTSRTSVDAGEIPPAYFERPYHLVAEGKTPKTYAVLRDAMAKKNLVAIALVVIRTRQHLCAVIPRGGALELELLRFAHELREIPARAAPAAAKATPKEIELAEQLIASMVSPWEPAKYKDTYRDDLLERDP